MKNRLTSFTALSCSLALLCSCASPPSPTAATGVTWTKVADGHYRSTPNESSEQKSDDLPKGANGVVITYGVFVYSIQAVATVAIVAVAIVALPFAGGGYGGGCI